MGIKITFLKQSVKIPSAKTHHNKLSRRAPGCAMYLGGKYIHHPSFVNAAKADQAFLSPDSASSAE